MKHLTSKSAAEATVCPSTDGHKPSSWEHGAAPSSVEARSLDRLYRHVTDCDDCQFLSWQNGRLCPVGERLREPPWRRRPRANRKGGPEHGRAR